MEPSAELLEVLRRGCVSEFRSFVLNQQYFIAKSQPFIGEKEWEALYHKAVLGYDELSDRWPDSVSWLAQNGFFSMLL